MDFDLEPVLIAKSNIILDVKPWDDETDMKELEKEVRKVSMDGLVWGACKWLFHFGCWENSKTETWKFFIELFCL